VKEGQIQLAPQNPADFQWATWIQDRHPRFKVHRTRGHAHSAISQRTVTHNYRVSVTTLCVLYERNDAEQVWDPVHTFTGGEVLRFLPWQKDPGPPEDRAQQDRLRRLEIAFASLECRIRDLKFEPVVEDVLLREARGLRNNLKFIAENGVKM
jgi:hypothetical protein